MATLRDEHKRYLVERFALFDSPSQAAAALKEEHGVEITRAQACKYHPDPKYDTSRGSRARPKPLTPDFVTLHNEIRKRFLERVSDVPIANKAYRLERLQRLLDRAEKSGNVVLEREVLEHGAKEMGDAFTNRRELTGAGGSAMSVAVAVTRRIVHPDAPAPEPAAPPAAEGPTS